MRNKVLVLILICDLALSFTCKKKGSECYYYTRPPDLIFEIKYNDKFVADSSILKLIKIYYLQKSEKKYVSDLTISDTIMTDTIVHRVITTKNIPSASGIGIKTFYVEFPISLGGDEDTLFVDYSAPATSNNCQYIFNQINYNSQKPTINSDILIPGLTVPIYIFNKP